MNSLFQDGITVGWLLGESFIVDHGRRSVIPERLGDALLHRDSDVITPREYYEYVHFSDAVMTDQEVLELPKAWVVGGDGGMGDIGYQNTSKVILQNRPNVKMLMLDTQVYSNTGGQNSDSSTMLGGYDMNQFGTASQGKLIEKKNVAEAFTSGHGSPFVAQVSMANAAKLYKAMLDGLEYRGTAFFQSYTTCQPEHGVSDNMSADQAKMVRDARGMPEFVFNPRNGETSQEIFNLQGNPSTNRDWWRTKYASTGEEYNFTVAHWALTEGRFRKHVKAIKEEDAREMIHLDDMLVFITQDDVIYRRMFNPNHRSYVQNFGCYIKVELNGKMKYYAVSRQMVLFAVERRKAWRMLQSKAGVVNKDYLAQKALLAKLDKGELQIADLQAKTKELFDAELAKIA
jgi:pyruvate-ferredoxin/flavodoxin oxidoreductase